MPVNLNYVVVNDHAVDVCRTVSARCEAESRAYLSAKSFECLQFYQTSILRIVRYVTSKINMNVHKMCRFHSPAESAT